ncbi:MAG: hypothetical protein LBB67_00675 [Oscillospiraceae bacterium]|nr:hypothetical protein [Oscillospiraceae bacterium]
MARITIFAGHYGSGKTTLAVNFAVALRRSHANVALCDMDIVNPYFRTADHANLLEAAGVQLIGSPYANTNVEMPWIPAEAQRIVDDKSLRAVIDLGGDDTGALALGRFAPQLIDQAEMLLVVNPCRPLTRGVRDLTEMRFGIENAAGLAFAGIVNNTNLGAETTAQTITAHLPLVREAARAMRLPIIRTAVWKNLSDQITLTEQDGQTLLVERYHHKDVWAID